LARSQFSFNKNAKANGNFRTQYKEKLISSITVKTLVRAEQIIQSSLAPVSYIREAEKDCAQTEQANALVNGEAMFPDTKTRFQQYSKLP
jgi:hypothetical protein